MKTDLIIVIRFLHKYIKLYGTCTNLRHHKIYFKYTFIISKFKSLILEPISKYIAVTITNDYSKDINKARRDGSLGKGACLSLML